MRLIKLRPRSDSIASEFSDLIETVCFDQESRRNSLSLNENRDNDSEGILRHMHEHIKSVPESESSFWLVNG